MARSYNWDAIVYTIGNLKDKNVFKEIKDYGIRLIKYRISFMLERLYPFSLEDTKEIKG